MNLSENFTLEEMTTSATARKYKLPNIPNEEQTENLRHLAQTILQPLRDKLGVPIKVESAFRSAEVNRKVGGERKSYHLCNDRYAAADIKAKGVTLETMMNAVIDLNLPVEEAIIEYDQGILHIAVRRPQRELLTRVVNADGKFVYSVYKRAEAKASRAASKGKPKKAARRVKKK